MSGRKRHDEGWILLFDASDGFEDHLISEIEVEELLKALPEMQRLAIQKRLEDIPLDEAERQALRRARSTVTKWLK